MAKISVYNLEGKEVEKLDLADSVFSVPKNNDLVHQVAVAISGNGRQPLAHTKNRGERAGSGRKPWKQKGTGRARVGSVRSPLWKKGGVTFGPRNDRNYDRKVNKKMRSKAVSIVLSGKVRDNELIVIDKFNLKEKKTKMFAEAIDRLKIKGKILMAFSPEEKDLRLASRNLKVVKNVLVNQLNVMDMLQSKNLLMSKESVKYLEEKYSKEK